MVAIISYFPQTVHESQLDSGIREMRMHLTRRWKGVVMESGTTNRVVAFELIGDSQSITRGAVDSRVRGNDGVESDVVVCEWGL